MRVRGFLLVLALSLLLAPTTAAAKVSLNSRTITLTTPGARAVITRNPFRLLIETSSGAPALEEVPNTRPGPDVLAPTVDPVPPGTDAQASGQLYAPLSFLVGQESVSQYNGLVWGGNLMSGERFGVQYSVRAVTSARPAGSGVTLTVSTDDPTGRTLRVTVSPAGSGLIGVSASPQPATGVAIMSDAFDSSTTEAFYGFGGRHNALNQHGNVLSSFVEEENITGAGGAGPTDLFPNGPTAAYYPQAQFVSTGGARRTTGYGFLLDQPQLARFRLDSDRPDGWSVAASAPALDYVVAPGVPAHAIAALTRVSGRQPVPPSWVLGPMLDRLVKNVGETQADYEQSLAQDLVNIARYRLPLSAYRIEGWGFKNPDNDGLALHSYVDFATQQRLIAALRRRGIHPLAYLRPWITPGSTPDREGLTVRQANGQTYATTGTTGQSIALLDFTNPAAVAYWRREVARVLDLGFDGFMADFGEEVLFDMHFADGQTGVTMHNHYPVLYMKATREAISAYERAHPRRKIWFFNRAGYTGSAAYEGGNFPGDETTDFSQAAGLASLTPDMLNRAVGGAYGYATDIGGYYDYTTPPTTKELFLRWAEWAALTPVFRLHGSGRSGTHTPWSYDLQTVRVYRALSLLHERAAPLILALWRRADRTGIPPTRPLWLEFPGDPRAAAQTQEWTLGNNVLVAPVVTQGATGRMVYFPEGCWRDPQTRLTEHGPASATVPAALTVLPFFFRCGTEPFKLGPQRRRR